MVVLRAKHGDAFKDTDLVAELEEVVLTVNHRAAVSPPSFRGFQSHFKKELKALFFYVV